MSGAWQWLESQLHGRPVPPLIVVVGLHEPAFLEELTDRAPSTRVLALEPDAPSAERFLACDSARRWRDSGRLTYLIDPSYVGAEDAWRMFPSSGELPPVFFDPAMALDESVGRAAQVLKRILFGVEANAEARRRLAPQYLVNTIGNIPAIVGGSDVRALTDAFRGLPAVLVAAGPSLDNVIDDLRRTRSKAVVFATDTAFRSLLVNGLDPQFVVGLDPSAANARHFHALPDCRNSWFIGETALDPSTSAAFGSRTFWFRCSTHQPWPWLQQHGIDVGRLDVWGSVLTAAFQCAMLAGCNPITIVGADLAYTGGRPYARGTTYEFEWAWSTAFGRKLEAEWLNQLSERVPITTTDLRGREMQTTKSLLSFRDWMVAQAARSGRRVVNATGAGMLVGEGVEQASLIDVLDRNITIPEIDTFVKRFDGVRPSALAATLRKTRQLVESGEAHRSPLPEWTEFGGPGLDHGTLAAALGEAARRLETKRRPLYAEVSEDASRAAAAEVAATFSRLPEAMTRLRMALDAADLDPAATTEPECRSRLLHTARLLRHACAAVLRDAEPAIDIDASVVGTRPVCAVQMWQPPVRWAVIGFEAALGVAWQRAVPAATPAPFLTGPVDSRASEGSASGADGGKPRATRACLLLAIEWLRCAMSQSVAAPRDFEAALDRLAAIERIARTTPLHPGGATLVLSLHSAGESERVEIPIDLDGPQLARIFSGALGCSAIRSSASIVNANLGGVDVSIAITIRNVNHATPAAASASTFVAPEVLTDGGVTRAIVAYTTADGAVCVVPHAFESIVIADYGSIRTHNRWPRPISGELPFHGRGGVAWSNGLAEAPEAVAPYVMFRRYPDETVTIQELPFRPRFGIWACGRVIWACTSLDLKQPSHHIAAWAPGEPATILHETEPLFGIEPDAHGLVLQPWLRGVHRQRAMHAERWRAERDVIEPIALGGYGSASCRSSAGDWTATAYPEADVVVLERVDGVRRELACYYPVRVAWTGDGLLVGTVDRELLLFNNLRATLERLR